MRRQGQPVTCQLHLETMASVLKRPLEAASFPYQWSSSHSDSALLRAPDRSAFRFLPFKSLFRPRRPIPTPKTDMPFRALRSQTTSGRTPPSSIRALFPDPPPAVTEPVLAHLI